MKHMDRQAEGWTDRQRDGQTNGQVDRQTGGQANGHGDSCILPPKIVCVDII